MEDIRRRPNLRQRYQTPRRTGVAGLVLRLTTVLCRQLRREGLSAGMCPR